MQLALLNPLRPDLVPIRLLQRIAEARTVFYDDAIPPELLLWSPRDARWYRLPSRLSAPPSQGRTEPDTLILSAAPTPPAWARTGEAGPPVDIVEDAALYPDAGLQGFVRMHARGPVRRPGWARQLVRTWHSGMLVLDGATAVRLRPVLRAVRDRVWLVEVVRHWPRITLLARNRRLRRTASWLALIWPRAAFSRVARRGGAPLVVIPRPWPEAWTMAEKVWRQGGDALPFPVIDFVAGDPAPERFRRDPGAYDWIVFTSPRGVDFFFQTLRAARVPLPDPTRIGWAAIGPATEARLHAWGVHQVLRHPTWYQAEGLMERFRDIPLAGRRILIPRAEGRPELVRFLRARGAHVDEWRIYRTVPTPARRLRPLVPVLEHARVVVFTSPSTYHHFRGLLSRFLDAPRQAAWWQRVRVGVIGPITGDAVRAGGHRVDFMATQAQEDELVQQVIQNGFQTQTSQPVASVTGDP